MTDEEYALPKLWKATDLTAGSQPKWLARGRIPRAAISLLVGDEGIGKSLFWVLIVAVITTGRGLAEFGIPRREPENVIVVVTEDDWSIVHSRLIVAGADMDRISVICTEDDGSGAPIFPRDMYLVTESDTPPGLLVVDAWLDTVPSNLSVKDPQQARRALHPWKEAAVLLLTHTNRMASANARDKYGATGELRKKARMALFAQADSDEDGCLLIGPEKANSAGKVVASKFVITAVSHFASTPDDDGTVPRLDLVGDSAQTMKEHISNSFDGQAGDQRGDYTGAAAWLEDYLNQQGRCSAKQAKTEGVKAGHNERTIERAAKKLKVVSEYQGFPRIAHWSLPNVVNLNPDEFTVSTDSSDNSTAHHSERVGTVGTEPDQAKESVGTGHELQLRQPDTYDGTGVGAVATDHADATTKGAPNAELDRWRVSGQTLHAVSDRHDSPTSKTARQWIDDHVSGLLVAGTDTVESLEVYTAGQRAGFKLDNLRQAAKKSDLIAVEAMRGGTAVWRLGSGGGNTVVPCGRWLTAFIEAAPHQRVKAADAYAAGLAAGYGREAVKGASLNAHIRKSGSSVATEWSLDRDDDARGA